MLRKGGSAPSSGVTDKQILRQIGGNIRAARLDAGLTQECLAELAGIHWKTISNIERGIYPVALTIFARLSQFLDVNPNDLPDGLEPPDPKRTARIKKALARRRAPAIRRKRGVREK